MSSSCIRKKVSLLGVSLTLPNKKSAGAERQRLSFDDGWCAKVSLLAQALNISNNA
jgi:hypothetical protein